MNYERKVTMAAHTLMAGLLALLFLPTIVAAQTGPVPSPPPACKPELVGGTGMFMTFGTSSEGTLFVRWACPGAAPGQWEIVGFSWDSNYIPKLPSAAAVLRSGDLFDALWRENVVSNLPITQAHADAEQRVREQVRAKLPTSGWFVASNGTRADRPTSTLRCDAAGKCVLQAAAARAAVGAPCDPARASFAIVGQTVQKWAAVAPWTEGNFPLVAVCRVQ